MDHMVAVQMQFFTTIVMIILLGKFFDIITIGAIDYTLFRTDLFSCRLYYFCRCLSLSDLAPMLPNQNVDWYISTHKKRT